MSAAASVEHANDDASSAATATTSSSSDDKYPRTPHFPFSPGATDDDVVSSAMLPIFGDGTEIHISEKLDGGNCCLKQGHVFARTHGKPATHESFSAVKRLYHTVLIPQLTEDEFDDLEFFGENMAAVHSLAYTDAQHALPAPFYLFAVRQRSTDTWWGVDQVARIAQRLGLEQPPVLFRGVPVGREREVAGLIQGAMKLPSALAASIGVQCPVEGFVARVTSAFRSAQFADCVSKCVRANHVQCEDKVFKAHWTRANICT